MRFDFSRRQNGTEAIPTIESEREGGKLETEKRREIQQTERKLSQKLSQTEKAKRFQELHQGYGIFALPNVWDVTSALIFEAEGYQAVGTTSAGVAASLGYPDGEQLPKSELIEVVRRISRAVELPVTVDIEAGFGDSVEEVAQSVREVIEAGAVGVNLEDSKKDGSDSLFEIEEQARKIEAIRNVAIEKDIPLLINARTDIFYPAVAFEGDREQEAITRLKAYRKAGADCLFTPFVTDFDLIYRLCQGAGGPLNILAVSGTPPIMQLENAGVKRVSVGSGVYRSAMGHVRRVAFSLKNSGNFDLMLEGTLPFPEMIEMLERSL